MLFRSLGDDDANAINLESTTRMHAWCLHSCWQLYMQYLELHYIAIRYSSVQYDMILMEFKARLASLPQHVVQ